MHLIRTLSVSPRILYKFQQTPFLIKKHYKNVYSIPLVRKHHGTYLHYVDEIACESCIADARFTAVLNSVKNINKRKLSKTNYPDFFPIQDAFLHFLIKLQEANEVTEQLIVVSSTIDEFREKQHFFEASEVDQNKITHNPRHWFFEKPDSSQGFSVYLFLTKNYSKHCSNTPNYFFSFVSKKRVQFTSQVICNTLDETWSEIFPTISLNKNYFRSWLRMKKFLQGTLSNSQSTLIVFLN